MTFGRSGAPHKPTPTVAAATSMTIHYHLVLQGLNISYTCIYPFAVTFHYKVTITFGANIFTEHSH